MKRIIKSVILAISLMLAVIVALPAFAASDQNSSGQYGKTITYKVDLEHGLFDKDPDWDLLHEVNVSDGAIYGFPTAACGEYGIGFKHRTPGAGKTVISASVKIPEGKSSAMISLRLTDYTDSRREPKGIRIWLGADGTIGLYDPGSRRLAVQNTGYTFSEGRKIYVEDDAGENVITVYVDDAGQKVKAAECVIRERKAEIRYENTELTPLTVEYGYEIYKDGYISLTSGVMKTYFSDISVTLTTCSAEVYHKTADSDVRAAQNSFRQTVLKRVIIFACIAGVLLIGAVVIIAALVKTDKKKRKEEKADGREQAGIREE